MGNRPSLRKRAKEQKPSAAALPPSIAAVTQQQHDALAAAVDAHAPGLNQQTLADAAPLEAAGLTALDDDNQLENDNNNNNSGGGGGGGGGNSGDEQESEGEEREREGEEDPLQFFRRLSSLSNGGSEGECESQDLFMSYTQALLLKERGDYAAASTLLRLVRNYKSLEIEAQHHLAQCLLMLDPELSCFGDEIVECLEKVCSTESSCSLADDSALQQMQRESTELLAHVLVSQGYAERARELLRALVADARDNQYEDQAGVAHFQTALCELVLGDLEAAHEQLAGADCRASLPLAHVDAQAVERTLADALWRQRARTSSNVSGRPAA